MKSVKSAIRLRDKSGRTRQLSVEEALAEAMRILLAGDYGNALLILEKAVRFAPFHAGARHLLGEVQAKAGSSREALYNLRKVVEAEPNNADYRASLARALVPIDPTEAVPHFLSAILLGSHSTDVFCKLGLILVEGRRVEDALKVYDLGLGACREQVDILANRAAALLLLGRYNEALACCRQACLASPQNAEAHFNLALTLLLGGHYGEGFGEYEWRWKTAAAERKRRSFAQPLWDGSPLQGKRILLHAEQGAGDSIQFARYLPLVAKLDGRIVLEVPASLVPLMRWLPGPHEVVAAGLPLGEFDAHCPLMSLPLLCGTDLASIPRPACFMIPAAIKEEWANRLPGGKTKVALVWAGRPTNQNDRNRSIPLQSLLPLLSAEEVDFFSFQVGPAAQQLSREGLGAHVRDLSPFLTDFGQTAAALCSMDLLISVDTAVAHLAGSLGKPVWTFIPFAPDWRWLLHRADSPWYPTMRLFRQKTWGDWEPVVREVLAALRAWPDSSQGR